MQATPCYAGERERRAAIAAPDEFLLGGGGAMLLSTVQQGLVNDYLVLEEFYLTEAFAKARALTLTINTDTNLLILAILADAHLLVQVHLVAPLISSPHAQAFSLDNAHALADDRSYI